MSDQFKEEQFYEQQPEAKPEQESPYLAPEPPFYREDVIMQMQLRQQIEKEQERLRQKALKRQQRRMERQAHGWKLGVAILSLITLSATTFGGVYWASDLLNRTRDAKESGSFFFPPSEKAVTEVQDITTLQNSEYDSIADIADDVGHSVVTIVTTVAAQDPTGIMGESYGEALGSGVIIGEEGDELYIATNFHVINVADGHDFKQLAAAFAEARKIKGQPSAIICKTVKGKDVSFMENDAGWHGKAPNEDQYKIAMADLERIGEAL